MNDAAKASVLSAALSLSPFVSHSRLRPSLCDGRLFDTMTTVDFSYFSETHPLVSLIKKN